MLALTAVENLYFSARRIQGKDFPQSPSILFMGKPPL
jgi:hypothetical protein